MLVAVIDGQGGGIGRSIIEKLRNEFTDDIKIIALGTNSLATSFMIKAGANEGATGENAIVYNAGRVDVIMGVVGIIAVNSMLGELTPLMAKAIAESPARKILVPLNRCNVEIVGIDKSESLPHLIDKAALAVKEYMNLNCNL
ncbi:MAG: DUF3842 family protein [Synergistaceae bacterium]|jgi:hypothetical protein|nr:DUF3842 family protein [Candidatus Cloacimonadota bacterium]MDD2284245.1 DUF3842 family protein [Paludibacter sp.]MDD4428602.1 DUF3842 family protein [Paludibacter sp.]MEA4872727.1 DUF3842 family protein [Synergistaceae bacterium]